MAAGQALVIVSEKSELELMPALMLGGWQVRMAGDASRAIQDGAGGRPDVVVLEPEALGDLAAVVVRRLQLEYGRRLPIVGVGASRPNSFLAAELALSDWLLLPLDAAVLLAATNHARSPGHTWELNRVRGLELRWGSRGGEAAVRAGELRASTTPLSRLRVAWLLTVSSSRLRWPFNQRLVRLSGGGRPRTKSSEQACE